MKIKDINLFEEDLLKMMQEFWAIDNNDTCAKETLRFLNKYKIDDNDEYGLRYTIKNTINQS
ncbi:hypothetical protein KKG81_07380 [bacterium]|nr:hypothetical protein [bacterium]